MKDLIIDYNLINSIDLSDTIKLAKLMPSQFFEGKQPYHLYAYISTLFENTNILDIGTEWGNSALALSYNKKNTIISYDIEDHGIDKIIKDNIIFKTMDFMSDKIDWKNISVILIDVDPHDSIQERKMLKFLEDIEWKGLLILDDIGPMFPHMNIWFHTIKHEKYILDPQIAHYSGTGIINFGGIYNISMKHN